jgi:hypothetical protein
MKAKKYLKGGQVKLDANKDGKISGKDFSMLRKGIKKYQKGGKAPEGEINLGSTIASKKRMTLGEAEEMNRRTTKNYGKDPASIRSGYASMDRRLDEAEQSRREARARAGNKYYDGDGGGAARREKAYADELEARSYAKMAGEKVDAYREKSKKERAEKGLKAVDTYNKSTAKMKKGGKVVKYQKAQNGIVVKGSDKRKSAASERERKLELIRENNRLIKEERALRQRQGFAKRLQGEAYDGGASGGFTQKEMEVFDRIRENGFTKPLDKSKL